MMITALVWAVATGHAADWPAWGRTWQRNMVAVEKKLPRRMEPGRFVPGTDQVDPTTTVGVRWVAKLGSQSYGNPTVADGRVYVGTNNQAELRAGLAGDRSVVMVFDEVTGALTWQLTAPKAGSGKVNDWEYIGVCSSPTVVDGVVYVLSSRGDVLALDPDGLADGNDGAQDEGAYLAGGGAPVELLPMDADILWSYNMPAELGVFPHNVTSSSVLVHGDHVFVVTSNGVDWSHIDLPSPFSPALVVLDRHTGELVAEEAVGISERTLHANWSSPLLVPAASTHPETVVFGAGDGFLYGFDPAPVEEDGLRVLHERWRYDGNLPTYRTRDGAPIKYPSFDGPSEFIATPVYADGLVYALIGQDPEHGPGIGRLSAVPVDRAGDISGEPVWSYEGISRSISTVAVSRGLVYAADYDGRLHCLDARTGAVQWVFDTGAHIWGSPLVVNGKVLLGNEDGSMFVFKEGRKLKQLDEIVFPAPIYSSPILANGTLYVATQTHLYAFDGR